MQDKADAGSRSEHGEMTDQIPGAGPGEGLDTLLLQPLHCMACSSICTQLVADDGSGQPRVMLMTCISCLSSLVATQS